MILAEMSDALRGGATFAGAAAEHPEAFPAYYIGILRSAEMTGNLDTVLDQLADYIERDIEARRKVSSALMYPAIVFCLGHRGRRRHHGIRPAPVQDVLHLAHAKLPLPTRMLLGVANFFVNDWYVIAAVVGACRRRSCCSDVHRRAVAENRDALLLKIPVLGDLISTAILERVCRILRSWSRLVSRFPKRFR